MSTSESPVFMLGYSPCPNDTFIFHALREGLTPCPVEVKEVLEDVQTLNKWATEGRLAMTKISYRAYFGVMDKYIALRSGGALGRGVGPLLVATESETIRTVASPGSLTTAELLLMLMRPDVSVVHMRYDEIIPAVQRGEYKGRAIDAGLIIHESRFTYANYGLKKLADLGEWWEQQTNLPLPLGAILVRRDVAPYLQKELNSAVKASLEYAYLHPEASKKYVQDNAQELSEEVTSAHINLYVNNFSLDVGQEGEAAVLELHRRAKKAGLVEASDLPLFV